MNQITMAYEQLIERFIQWAETEANIRGAYIIGSRARTDHPADEWSDLDMIILANDPQPYSLTTAWLSNLGAVWVTFTEPLPNGAGFERRALFEGGLDVDFVPVPVEGFRQMLKEGLSSFDADVLRRGIRIVVDKDNLFGQLAAVKVAPPAPTSPPDQAEFLNLVNDFWYHTVWTAKKLRRGELWTAKSCSDIYLKHLLLKLLEWHARAVNGAQTDTWMRGRFLEQWADPRAVAALPAIFAHYEVEDMWRALETTMELFRWLACETANLWDYEYPTMGDEHTTELVQQLFVERG
jgi:aminoglycoside 6-adenylyltransferase